MTESRNLERRYRRLLTLYPNSFRREREEEMVSVLMDGAHGDQRWPRFAEIVNLLGNAAPTRLRQGPPPGSLARRHPRGVITTRILVALWLTVVTVFLCRYSLWALMLLVVVALHAYLTARTAAFLRHQNRNEPPAATLGGS